MKTLLCWPKKEKVFTRNSLRLYQPLKYPEDPPQTSPYNLFVYSSGFDAIIAIDSLSFSHTVSFLTRRRTVENSNEIVMSPPNVLLATLISSILPTRDPFPEPEECETFTRFGMYKCFDEKANFCISNIPQLRGSRSSLKLFSVQMLRVVWTD